MCHADPLLDVFCCDRNAIASEKWHPDLLLDILCGVSAVESGMGRSGPSLELLHG
jgi:hypothetical protein